MLSRLHGAAARSWARRYVKRNVSAIQMVADRLTPDEVVKCLKGIDLTVQRRTGQSAKEFLV